jgi:hypothetical protein
VRRTLLILMIYIRDPNSSNTPARREAWSIERRADSRQMFSALEIDR